MRIIAPMIILIMMTSTLAGCTGGDPDSGGNDDIDMDVLNSLIDDNLQDFINNTTITVENHYHNNTTIVNNHYDSDNHFNNTTNIDGGEINNYDDSVSNINSSGTSLFNTTGDMYLLDIIFTLEDLYPGWDSIDYRNNTFNYSWEYYDYATNQNRIDMFEFSCQVFYVVGANSTNGSNQVSYWQDYSEYSNAWANMYNNTVRNLLTSAASNIDSITSEEIEMICNENSDTSYDGLLFEIPLAEGMALKAYSEPSWSYYHHEYVWANQCLSGQFYYGEYSWEESYRPNCQQTSWPTGGNQVIAFYVNYEFETIPWSYGSGGWVGGSSDTVLEVYVDNIRPNWEYRLIVYFEMTTNMNNFE